MANEYTTKAQLLIELGTHGTNLTAGLEDADITAIIEKQSRVLDNLLQSVLTVPLTTVPDVIEDLCLIFVSYKLWKRKSFKDIPENVQKDYDRAFKLIEKMQSGKIQVGTEQDRSDQEDEMSEEGLIGGASQNLVWQSKSKSFTSDLS